MAQLYEDIKKPSYGLSAQEKQMLEEIKTKVPIIDIFKQDIYPHDPNYWPDGMASLEDTETCLCPLHVEDTASMRIFPDTNTCSCYAGCGGGDGVWLFMEYHRKVLNEYISFKKAIHYLYDEHVRNKSVANVTFTSLMKQLREDKPEELFLYLDTKVKQHNRLISNISKVPSELAYNYTCTEETVRQLMQVREITAIEAQRALGNAFKEISNIIKQTK